MTSRSIGSYSTLENPRSSNLAIERFNVGDTERLLYGMTGFAFVFQGFLKRGSWNALAMAITGGGLVYIGATGRNPVYRALGISLVRTRQGGERVEVIKSMTINRPANELFAFWRDFRNLPRIMTHLESVEILSEKCSHWRVSAPAGLAVEWDAEIVNEKSDKLIAWQSSDGAGVANWGAVRFTPAPGNRGTEVTVQLEYEPIGGAAGVAFAKLFGEEPSQQIEEDLRRFKQFMETGEVPTTTGQSKGRSGRRPAFQSPTS
jgi:uncharacterized membrane protein